MDRLTKKLPDGSYDAAGHDVSSLSAALGRFEDVYEGLVSELEITKRLMAGMSAGGQARSATYTMLMGSKYAVEEMKKRLEESAEDMAQRLNYLNGLLDLPNKAKEQDDGYRDVE